MSLRERADRRLGDLADIIDPEDEHAKTTPAPRPREREDCRAAVMWLGRAKLVLAGVGRDRETTALALLMR